MVGVQGFEPWTPCSQSRCATRLRYTPTESIFYTEMIYGGKYCNMKRMNALFLSKLRKQFRGFIALSFLLASLLGTHWIGFAHGIHHSGLSHQTNELSCSDNATEAQHSTPSCHLFDALTLAGFIASEPNHFISINAFGQSHDKLNKPYLDSIHAGQYQPRAPPTFIL